MYKNQLQELAQHSSFNLPSYSSIREGPDHAPRFKATVIFNGETFESPAFYSTLRQAEHAAAEAALSTLAKREPSKSLASKALDETGVYKNLLQETAHRAGLKLPEYATTRSGPGHFPVFSCTVELAGKTFMGEPAKTKKQAEKNAAMVAWSTLKQMSQCGTSSPSCHEEQVVIARFLSNQLPSESTMAPESSNRKAHKDSSLTCTGPQNVPKMPNTAYEHHQSWGSSSLSPEMAMYYMWLQEQMTGQQSHPQGLLVPPPPPGSQFYPLMSSMLQPSYHAYSTPRSCSPLYSLNQFGPIAISPRSVVSIQEVQKRKLEDSSKPSVPGSSSTEAEESGQLLDDRREVGLAETQVGYSSPMQENHSVQSGHNSPMDSSPNMHSSNFWLQNPLMTGLPQSDPRSGHHLTSNYLGRPRHASPTAPVLTRAADPMSQFPPRMQTFTPWTFPSPRMRPAVPPMRPGVRMQNGGLPSRPMAPSVQVRSAVPVFSTPPGRQMTGPNREGVRPTSSEVNNREQDVSVMSSELDKLQL